MGKAGFMEPNIRFDHLLGNPGALAVGAGVRTGLNYPFKCGVHGHAEALFLEFFAQTS